MGHSEHTAPRQPSPSAAPAGTETIEIKAGVFKDVCLKLMDDVRERRRQYVITKRGRPVAKLVPPNDQPASSFGMLRGTIVSEGDIVSPDFEAWGELA